MTDNAKRFQFFTSEVDDWGGWKPIDHFFYAPRSPDNTDKGSVVWLETHANPKSGRSHVSIIEGEGDEAVVSEFTDIPTALRKMADIIEAHTHSTK
jgi:hypothetical protein